MIIYMYICDTNIDFKNKHEVEIYFRSLFLKLKNNYNIELSGFYNIEVYYDAKYGAIMELEKEEFDYYPAFEESLDMRITTEVDTSFLYELDDVLDIPFSKDLKIYQYKDKYYAELKQKLKGPKMGRLIEFSKPIYGDVTKNIVKYGKKIEI